MTNCPKCRKPYRADKAKYAGVCESCAGRMRAKETAWLRSLCEVGEEDRPEIIPGFGRSSLPNAPRRPTDAVDFREAVV